MHAVCQHQGTRSWAKGRVRSSGLAGVRMDNKMGSGPGAGALIKGVPVQVLVLKRQKGVLVLVLVLPRMGSGPGACSPKKGFWSRCWFSKDKKGFWSLCWFSQEGVLVQVLALKTQIGSGPGAGSPKKGFGPGASSQNNKKE